jgi:hypothetical protein
MSDKKPPGDDEPSDPMKHFFVVERTEEGANDEALHVRLHALLQEHSDLDAAIRALETQASHDRLAVARLKKRKLQLKDQMQVIKDRMTPDIIA